MKLKNIFFALLLFFSSTIPAAEWQWSVQLPGVVSSETNDHPRAFLWILFPGTLRLSIMNEPWLCFRYTVMRHQRI